MIHGTHNALEDIRNEAIQVFVNGDFLPRQEAKISVFDSGYLVGDGLWEGIRVYNGVLVFHELHLARLWQGAATIGMNLPFTPDELIANIRKTLEVNHMRDGVHVRVMVTRGIKKTPSQDPRLTISGPNVVIIAEHKVASPETSKKGINLFTSTIRRGSPDYLDPRLNCHSKLHEVQALIQALEAGADEALMLDINGFVATCNATNFFMVKDQAVWTSTGQYCMNGITRQKTLEAANRSGYMTHEKNFSLFDVYGADEAFVTGTFGGITPVLKVDGRKIGAGSIGKTTKDLQTRYRELVEAYVDDFKKRS
jgi:branched-chain amino acid aminotransferase